jgi:hypothetical protein
MEFLLLFYFIDHFIAFLFKGGLLSIGSGADLLGCYKLLDNI